MQATMARRRAARKARKKLFPLVGAVLGALVLAIALVVAWPRTAAAVAPPSPLALQQWGANRPLAAGGALNRATLTVSFQARAGTSVAVPEVEVAVAGQPFSGRISARGAPLPVGGHATTVRVVARRLRDGVAYHWRARLRGRDGRVSPWMAFGARGRPAFTVDLTPPPAPRLSSPTHPDPASWYTTTLATLAWTAPRDASGIAGYTYSLDRSPHGRPAPRVLAHGSDFNVLIPSDGVWYVHVRAADRAGNWSPVATYPLHVDRHPAAFANVSFSRLAFDPDIERESIAVSLGGPARLSVRILSQIDGSVVRTLALGHVPARSTVTWDGRDDRGRPAPAGDYRFLLTATDQYGQQSVADYSNIGVVRRRLVVSLSKQRMVAYDGARQVKSTLVTTGNKALPTPLGTFHIIEKLRNFTFISPWPKGSPYYYAPSPVQYALLFNWNGYYIHDAPWRSVFGPGSNARLGTPGQNLTGTHGCVNIPPAVAAWLYDWAPVGTVVQVAP